MDEDRVHARRWWTLAVLCFSLIIIGVDNTILNVALPSIVRDLGASGSELQWMVDAYTIVFACLLLTAGSLGDRYGRRRALMFGLAWFATFSATASLASSPAQLIGARAAMGIGGAFIYPTTLSILTNTFHDPGERAKAIGIWAGVAGVGIAIGPLAGGLLVEHFGWDAIFLVNVPICATALILCPFFIPNTSDREESPLDPIGALLSILGLVTFLYAVIEGPDKGWTSSVVLAGFALGAIFIALFWWWELHCTGPMLDVRFFKNPRFTAASATITLTYFALFSSTFLLTLYFQFILHYSPLKSGMMLTPVALGLMIASPMAPRLVVRFGTKWVVVAGLTIVGFAMACYGSNTLMSSFGIGLLIRFIYGCGVGITTPPVTESIMGSLPRSRAGVGSAVNDTTRQTGGAVGVAVIGSLFAARYHAQIGSLSFLPAGVRQTARESIGTSLTEAAKQPAGAAQHLIQVSHAAFLSSMRLTYAVLVLVIAAAIVVAFKWLPAHAPAVDDVPAAPAVPLTEEPAVPLAKADGVVSRSKAADGL
jgi:EmrB/QacA subfamily drug resistance transporter